jgi:hypothetical protein
MVPICFNSRKSYEHNLKAILSAPFDPVELKQKWINVSCRKMMSLAIETGVETLDLRTTRLGSAYIDHYPGVRSCVSVAIQRSLICAVFCALQLDTF